MSIAKRQEKTKTEKKLINILNVDDDVKNRRPPCMDLYVYNASALDVEFRLSTYQVFRYHVEYSEELSEIFHAWLMDMGESARRVSVDNIKEWAEIERGGTAPYAGYGDSSPIQVQPGTRGPSVLDESVNFVAWNDGHTDETYLHFLDSRDIFMVYDYGYLEIAFRDVTIGCPERNCRSDYLTDRSAGVHLLDDFDKGVARETAETIVAEGQPDMFNDEEFPFFNDKAVFDEENNKMYCSTCLEDRGEFTEVQPMGLLEF